MADLSNLAIGDASSITDLVIQDANITELQDWLGNVLWQKSSEVIESWVPFLAEYVPLVEFTPSVNMSVDSFELISTKNSFVYNYAFGIYNKSTKVGITDSVGIGTSGISIVSEGTHLGKAMYRHKKTYLGTKPSLIAGVTYLFLAAERYTKQDLLSGNNLSYQTYSWASGGDALTQPVTSVATPCYLKVNPVP